MTTPNYKAIYRDLVQKKYPSKLSLLEKLFQKENISAIEIIEINKKIFGLKNQKFNQKHRSYSKSDIIRILKYQKKNKLTNTQLAEHYKLSRNSIAKWKKLFYV